MQRNPPPPPAAAIVYQCIFFYHIMCGCYQRDQRHTAETPFFVFYALCCFISQDYTLPVPPRLCTMSTVCAEVNIYVEIMKYICMYILKIIREA